MTNLARSAAAFIILSATAVSHGGELTFTFIGNMAFHITDGEQTLLSDFPYSSGAFGYMEYDEAEVPPIENGLCLITHTHTDHWNARLFEAMDTKVIAPPAATTRLDQERVVPLTEDALMTVGAIQVEAIKTPHRLAPQHYSYLVTWHGVRLYFPGDTETPEYMLKERDIDVMFISPWLVRTIERQDLSLDTEVLVVYHQKADEDIPPFQDYKRMEPGASFTVSFDEP